MNLIRAGGGRELTGSVGFIHQFIDMPAQSGTFFNEGTNRVEPFRGCRTAMGISFGAGTMDGPGGFNFTQGDTSGNPFWEAVRDFLAEPTPDDIACHHPKPILLMTGGVTRPYVWQPQIIPTQLFGIGDAVIVGLPGEFVTMAGRRVRNDLRALAQNIGRNNIPVFLSGMSNTYSSYTTTLEEYQIQRYEGASTAYGPHTLVIYQQAFNRQYTAMVNNQVLPAGPLPPDQRAQQMTFLPPIINDDATGSFFGAIIRQPNAVYSRGQLVMATFVSGNPRNNVMLERSFFSVEFLQGGTTWVVVATDGNWETTFEWRRTSTIIGRSEIDFFWDVPSTATPGTYRIRHEGHSRGPIQGVQPYAGMTVPFTIQ